MRLTVIHDSKGNITGLVGCPADGPAVYPATEPGELLTLVEVPEIPGELDGRKLFERLSDLADNYRVDVESKGRLTKKVESKTKGTRKVGSKSKVTRK
jgi:hypothetical protein